jgi:hypothetical protein
MKAHLHVHDGDAQLEIIAETEFEKRALAMCHENFPIQSLRIVIDEGGYLGQAPRTACALIDFEPKPQPFKSVSLNP